MEHKDCSHIVNRQRVIAEAVKCEKTFLTENNGNIYHQRFGLVIGIRYGANDNKIALRDATTILP